MSISITTIEDLEVHLPDVFNATVGWLEQKGFTRDDAEDGIQTSMLDAVAMLNAGVPIHNLQAWLRTAAFRAAHKHRKQSLLLLPEGLTPADTSHTSKSSMRDDHGLVAVMNELPMVIRETVTLVCILNMTYHKSSLLLGVSTGTVSKRLNQARMLLLNRFRQFGGKEENEVRAVKAKCPKKAARVATRWRNHPNGAIKQRSDQPGIEEVSPMFQLYQPDPVDLARLADDGCPHNPED